MQTALGIDIGGTRCRAALVAADGSILGRADAPTPDSGAPHRLGKVVARLADEASEDGDQRPTTDAVGLALPGIWDRNTGVMQRAVNLPAMDGVNLRELFEAESALSRPVRLETDVIAAGWAVHRRIAPRPARFVYLSLGTGVGGCVILDGEILRHTRGGAGHFGHLIVDTASDASLCRCGARGCLEAIVGGGLAGNWHRADPSGGTGPPGGPAVRALSIALLQLAHLYAPECVVLGGGVIEHNPELIEQMRAAFSEIASSLVPEAMRIDAASLSTDQAGAVGAALLAMG